MKAQKFNINDLPNLPEEMTVFNVQPKDYSQLEAIGGKKSREKAGSSDFRIPRASITVGEVWVGHNTPPSAYNRYQVGNLEIKSWDKRLFAEISVLE